MSLVAGAFRLHFAALSSLLSMLDVSSATMDNFLALS